MYKKEAEEIKKIKGQIECSKKFQCEKSGFQNFCVRYRKWVYNRSSYVWRKTMRLDPPQAFSS
jgi:hypothetical protein